MEVNLLSGKRERRDIEQRKQPRRLRFGSWNVGMMTGKSLEIQEVITRRRLDILCEQETKWRNTANRARFLDPKTRSHKMFYYGTKSEWSRNYTNSRTDW